MWTSYHTPATLDDALALLAHFPSDARIIAGGTDLLIEIERGLRAPRALIDITRIPGLDAIRLTRDAFHIGPQVTHNQAAASPVLAERAYPLARACWEVGAPQIRNRGTIAGNLITASPANDAITPLWALGAAVTLRSVRGERTLPFEQFFVGVRKTALQADEMLIDVAFPALAEDERGVFIKLGLRRSQAVSVVNAAVVLGFDREAITKARITLGSVAPTIVRAAEAEDFLTGQPLTDAVIARAARLAVGAARPIDDVRGPAEYRSDMVRVLVARALRQLRDRTERADWPERPAMLWGATGGRAPTAASSALHAVEADQPVVTTINGRARAIRGANDKTLLDMLRDEAGLTGTKQGCGEGECGACTVYLDGVAVMACLVPAPRAHGSSIVTVEGLAGDGGLHPVQRAFIAEDAVQCGYCTPGFVMAGAKLLEEIPHPTRAQIAQAIGGNLCRCTGYVNIVNAIERAASDAHQRPAL